jgi:hypothetical protein
MDDMILILLAFGGIIGVGIGAFLVWMFFLRFNTWIELWRLREDRTKRIFLKGSITKDKNFVKVKGEFFPIMNIEADEFKGKPCYSFACIQPGVYVPLKKLELETTIMVDQEVEVEVKNIDENGVETVTMKKVKKKVPKVVRYRDIVSMIDFDARAFYEAAREEADKIYREKENLRKQLLQMLPFIIASVIIIIGLVFVFLISTNLPAELVCECVFNASANVPIH